MTQVKTKSILKASGLKMRKNLGQNLLIDNNICRKIAEAAVTCHELPIIEIGPGLGALTTLLAKLAKQIIAIELDKNMARLLLDEILKPQGLSNVIVLNHDCMDFDFSAYYRHTGKKLQIVGNLPYYISTPLLVKILDNAPYIKSATIMLQKEVAMRLTAKTGSKDYSRLSVLSQARARVHKVCQVPPTCFHPRPKIWSQVIHMDLTKPALPDIEDFDFFKKIIKAGFGQRRKTLLNSLTSGLGIKREQMIIDIKKANLPENIRAEALELEDFARLYKTFLPYKTLIEV